MFPIVNRDTGNEMINRVWVVQEGKNDYSSAEEEYGEVHFITEGELRNIPGSQQNIDVVSDIRKFRSEYIPGKDYIIPAGNPMVVALVTMSLGPGNHNFLKWDGRRASYIPFKLNPEILK